MSLPSRKVTVVDVPDIQNVEAKFIYNFFTPDERTNNSGDSRVPGAFYAEETQMLINNRTLRSEVPRYVEVNFEPSFLKSVGTLDCATQGGSVQPTLQDYGENLKNIADEDQITNESYTGFRENDPNGKVRIGKKVQELSNVLGLSFEDSNQSLELSDLLGVQRSLIQDLISPYNDEKTLFVNKLVEAEKFTLFDKAASLTLSSLLNIRSVEWMTMGGDDVSPLSTLQAKDMSKEMQEKFNSTANGSDLNSGDVHPTLYPYKIENADDQQVGILGAANVGYIVVKKLITPSGKVKSISEYLLEGPDSTRYLDASVVYGAKYSYSVKAVYRIDAIVEDDLDVDGNKSLKKVQMLISSRPSKVITVMTEEYQPPQPPDGVFYRFNYNKGRGLLITWQIPPGASRDVKYFQVFRRKTIHEPFQCIAALDFDDSFLKTAKPEKVRKALVTKSAGAVTFFEDTFFNRDRSDFIYALCAVDAHGLSSNYSSQTLVGFDKVKNALTLKSISPPGGFKAYPNIFIDPDLDDNIAVDSFAQDAIFDSGHTEIRVYFTPDARSVQVSDNSIAKGFITQNEGGKYKMHLLNLDLQKSTTAEIEIEDLQQTQ